METQDGGARMDELVSTQLSWGQKAEILLEVDRSQLWKGKHASFTAWMREAARKASVHESVLWRILSAGRYYQALGGEYHGVKLPPLSVACKLATAEQFELVEKISRVAPPNVVAELLRKALASELIRGKLREAWQLYRPAALGKTTRGPKENRLVARRQPGASKSPLVHRASALYSLLEARPSWTGYKQIRSYRTFVDPPIGIRMARGDSGSAESDMIIYPDFIAVVRPSARSDLEFHVVEVITPYARVKSLVSKRLTGWLPYADFVWAIVDVGVAQTARTTVPDYVGILSVEGDILKVVRPAHRHPQAGARGGDVARILLAELL